MNTSNTTLFERRKGRFAAPLDSENMGRLQGEIEYLAHYARLLEQSMAKKPEACCIVLATGSQTLVARETAPGGDLDGVLVGGAPYPTHAISVLGGKA